MCVFATMGDLTFPTLRVLFKISLRDSVVPRCRDKPMVVPNESLRLVEGGELPTPSDGNICGAHKRRYFYQNRLTVT